MTAETLKRIDGWGALEAFAEECRQVGHVARAHLAFRGQSCPHDSLLPTLARGLRQCPEHHHAGWLAEHYVRSTLVSRLDGATHSFLLGSDLVAQDTLLRHHGAPSRLLDWTLSPFVALFFACAQDFDQDGELWRASTWAGELRSRAEQDRWSELLQWFHETTPQSRFAFLEPPHHTARSSAQQCIFSVSDDPRADHADLIERVANEALVGKDDRWRATHGLTRLVIPHELRREFLERLHHRNVHAAALFPDIEGLARYGDHVLNLMLWKTEQHLDPRSREHTAQVRSERESP